MEGKKLFNDPLELQRERGDHSWVALTLDHLSETNRRLGLSEEGIQQAMEAL
jgi:hypothetical protein